MVWFTCDACADTIKKPKLANHFASCRSHSFTCVDCCQTFDRNSAKGHNQCVTEHEKYALGATKPGGFAAQGIAQARPQQGGTAPPAAADATGLQFLSTRPPWKCSVCNVNCTSRETLMSHAAGVKHRRRARAATGGAAAAAAAPQEPAAPPEAAPESNGASTAQPSSNGGLKGTDHQQALGPAASTLSDAAFTKLIRVVRKKLKVKGKVGPKKLRALSLKKLGVSMDDLDTSLLSAIRNKLVAEGVAKLEGTKLLPPA